MYSYCSVLIWMIFIFWLKYLFTLRADIFDYGGEKLIYTLFSKKAFVYVLGMLLIVSIFIYPVFTNLLLNFYITMILSKFPSTKFPSIIFERN